MTRGDTVAHASTHVRTPESGRVWANVSGRRRTKRWNARRTDSKLHFIQEGIMIGEDL